MRNLILNQIYSFSIYNLLNENAQSILSVHFDEFSKNLTVLDKEYKIYIFNYDDIFSKFSLLKTIELDAIFYDQFEILEEISNPPQNYEANSIKFLLYKNEEETIYIISYSGKLLKIPLNGRYEITQLFPNRKILAVEMASNLEFIAVASSDNRLHLLNYDFDLVNSCDLDDGDMTDFNKDSQIDMKEASISWRGDSQFFATLYTINGGKKCIVRDTKLNIFKGPARADNKVVFSIAETPVKNLANCISWQPSGSLISVFQNNSKTNNLNDFSAKPGILFGEKNCLRHGEFYLKYGDLQIEDNQMNEVKITGKILKWNMDMPMLMVYLEKETPTKEITHQINIYHRSNYEWSLKYSRKVNKLIWTKFSDCLPLRAFLLSENGNFEILDFKLEYQNSLNNNNLTSDNGSISVLSANKVKLTPLRFVNMPPPMSLAEISLNNSPPYVINWWKNYLFVLSNSTVEIIHSDNMRNFSYVKKFSDIPIIDTSQIKSLIFIKNAKDFDPEGIESYYLTEGFLIFNRAIPNEDKIDELVFLLIKLKVNFTKNTNEKEYLEFSEISHCFIRIFEKISFLFNSAFSDGLYDKKFYNDKLSELQMSSGLLTSVSKDKEVENKDGKIFNEKDKKNKLKKTEKEDFFTKLKNSDFDNLDIGNYTEENLNNSYNGNEENNLFAMLGAKGKHPEMAHPHHQPGHLYKHTGKYSIFFFIVALGKSKEKELSKIRVNFDVDLFIEFLTEKVTIDQTKILRLEYEEEAHIVSSYDITKAHSAIVKSEDSSSNSINISLEEKIAYLTRNNRLYIGNNYIAADTTSFEIFKNFLIFTQSSNSPYNILHIINLSSSEFSQSLKQQSNKNDPIYSPNFNYKHFSMRTLERTSLIVTVTRNNLIVQMSRGNLETFYPRLLVLDSVVESVMKRNYLEAFELVRKNKINPNFLYDIDPEGFFININKFVNQVKKIDYINLFINCLENNLCEEIQQIDSIISSKEDFKKLYIDNKINKICDALRIELGKINENDKYITSIIHTHTKKTPSEYLEALRLIQVLKKKENDSKSPDDIFNLNQTRDKKHKNADQALEYLCWVVNAETLFDFSLKTYDLELVIIVAKYTQKDPKEYLPYLKKLQEMEPVLMKYTINIDLKYYEDALIELSKAEDKYFELCLELIDKYEIYEVAFSLFAKNENLLSIIFDHYGANLKTKKNYFDAGYAYLANKNYENAIECFKENGSVIEILKILPKLKNSAFSKLEEQEKLFLEIIDVATSNRKYTEIEKLLAYMENNKKFLSYQLLSKSMDSLIRGKRFHLAHSICSNESENINTETLNKLKKEFSDSISLAANLKTNELKKNINFYKEKYSRLLKVQHQKRLNPEMFNLENKELEDNVSDSGSIISSGSKKSSKSKKTTSSRLTKKSQAKMSKRNVREGSPLEEDFLIMIIGELHLSEEHITEIYNLINVLYLLGKADEGKELSIIIQEYLKNVNPFTKIHNVAQQDFINKYPEIKQIFPNTFNLGKIDDVSLGNKPKGTIINREHNKQS